MNRVYPVSFYGLGVTISTSLETSEEFEAVSFDARFTVRVARARVELHIATKDWDRDWLRVTSGRIESGMAWSVDCLGLCLRELNQVAEALAVLDRGVLIHGDTHPVFHYNLACYHSQFGNFKRARMCLTLACEKDTAFKKIAAKDPDLLPLWTEIARLGEPT